MGQLIVVLVLLAVGLWIAREVAASRARTGETATAPAPTRTRTRQKAPPRRKVDERVVAERLPPLREAVERGDVTLDEAANSLVRLTDGALSTDDARTRLRGRR